MSSPQPHSQKQHQQTGEKTSFAYNAHGESVFDDSRVFPSVKPGEIAKFDQGDPELINHATITALIVQLTSPEVIDYNLVYDFFITYRMFSDASTVMGLLMRRLVWSLQYVNKQDEESHKIGTLVLLRTFVVLRHWILNYFIDDFNSDLKLCDTFITNLNEVVFESGLINESMVFERKIIKDLKTHWLTLSSEFWNVHLDLSSFSGEEVFDYYLPATSDISMNSFLKKSNTEISLHTNPSYRRSAMLSLYDQKMHHKCLVFDDSRFSNNENPQLSVNNLLVSHKSSRQSIMNKLNHFNIGKSKHVSVKDATVNSAGSGPSNNNSNTTSPLGSSNRHNRMNLNDSSVGLRKTTKNRPTNQQSLNDEMDKISLNPIQIDNVGFSTNGNVKLPSSKVLSIVPSTPVKKMEYSIRNPLEKDDETAQGFSVNDWESPINYKIINSMDITRKNSIKKILEGWKKNRNHSNKSNDEINKMINDSITEDVIGTRIDVLSARIIDELEFLIRHYVQNDASYNPTIAEGDTIDNTNALNSPDEVDLHELDGSRDLDETHKPQNGDESVNDDVDINDVSELNLHKIDNLFSEQGDDDTDEDNEEFQDSGLSANMLNDIHEFSFQRPTSINWADDNALELDTSQTPAKEEGSDEELPEPNLPRDNSGDFNHLAEPPFPFIDGNNNFSSVSTISTPSNITDYNAEIEDLGIAMSPKSKEQQTKRISFSKHSSLKKRVSRNSSNSLFKRDSVKSYLSYDSAYSFSKDSLEDDRDNGHLRKKAGINDLRRMAGIPSERRSLENALRIQSNASVRKSVRASTLLALSELPFNGMYDSRSSIYMTNHKVIARSSGVGDSSIFSVAMKSRNSLSNSLKTLNESSRLSRTSPLNEDYDDFAFGFRASSDEGFGESETSTRSVVIPGISNNVLKELAAIPDDSFHFNPIDVAFNKLEGAKSQGKNLQSEEELNNSEVTQVELNDTQDILNEINNAHTEDIIESSSQKDFTAEMPLTPVAHRVIDVGDSSGGTLDSTQLEQGAKSDNVFIFSANYTTELEIISPSEESKTVSTVEPRLESPRLILESYNMADTSLAISNVMADNTHISFVLSYTSEELSQHFTMVERDILQEIDWKELVELKWNKELTPVNSWLEIIVNEEYYNSNKGVNLVIARFNLMVNWIISEVLLSKQQEERVQIISRFIHIAQSCLILQNYSTLMQILLALTSERLAKLRETWKSLPPGDILVLKNLEELASPVKNFLNLRVSINRIQPSRGCIPFVGLYLSDLIFNTERHKFIDKGKTVVNFARFRTSVHIVKSLSQCIEWSSYYKLNVNNELLSKCLYIRSLDEDEMNYCLKNVTEA
ncbi:Guanine nucleotide exchange factor lte1 [Yamadazyma tenuis]|nr:Guanine nucleotide exchange factor lte1 [Yamadazyma tenuis]